MGESRGARADAPFGRRGGRDVHRLGRELAEALARPLRPKPKKPKPAPGAEPDDINSFIIGRSPVSDVRPEAETYRIAYAKGYSVKFPEAHELFVDIDDEMGMTIFKRGMTVLQSFNFNAKITRQMPSPSGEPHHYHIVVALNRDLEPLERLVFQAILGSDPKREILGMEHLRHGEARPTRFFEKKTGRKAKRRMEVMQKAMAVEMLGKEENHDRRR
jgi:hypothetical protein